MQMAAKDTDAPTEPNAQGAEAPVLDISQAAIKKMIAQAKARGTITYDELNKALPPDAVSSEQIEDVMALLSEMGVNVVRGGSFGGREGRTKKGETSASKEVATTSGNAAEVDRTDDPVRMYLREMGSVELLSARARLPSPSASKPAATR